MLFEVVLYRTHNIHIDLILVEMVVPKTWSAENVSCPAMIHQHGINDMQYFLHNSLEVQP